MFCLDFGSSMAGAWNRLSENTKCSSQQAETFREALSSINDHPAMNHRLSDGPRLAGVYEALPN